MYRVRPGYEQTDWVSKDGPGSLQNRVGSGQATEPNPYVTHATQVTHVLHVTSHDFLHQQASPCRKADTTSRARWPDRPTSPRSHLPPALPPPACTHFHMAWLLAVCIFLEQKHSSMKKKPYATYGSSRAGFTSNSGWVATSGSDPKSRVQTNSGRVLYILVLHEFDVHTNCLNLMDGCLKAGSIGHRQ